MTTPVMPARIAEASPRAKARLAGVCEALEGVTSSSGQVFILGKLVVAGNAVVTAGNILAHERLVWFGFALSVAGAIFHVVWTLLFYELFKPVSRSVSRVAAGVMLVGCAIQALTALLYITPLLVLTGGSSLSAFTPAQVQALAMVFVRLNTYAFDVDLVFFGLWCVLTGYLIFKSTFMPRILGVLLAIDGLGWMLYLAPPAAYRLFPFIAAASAVSEIPLQLWLLIMGVNPKRWKEQAAAALAR
jgi:hypothetical protein